MKRYGETWDDDNRKRTGLVCGSCRADLESDSLESDSGSDVSSLEEGDGKDEEDEENSVSDGGSGSTGTQ